MTNKTPTASHLAKIDRNIIALRQMVTRNLKPIAEMSVRLVHENDTLRKQLATKTRDCETAYRKLNGVKE